MQNIFITCISKDEGCASSAHITDVGTDTGARMTVLDVAKERSRQ